MTFLWRLLSRDNNERDIAINRSNSCHDALADPNSELSRFLFIPTTQQQNDREANTKLNSLISFFYAFPLSDTDVQSNRIVMIFEAYTLFSALFLGGTWIIYEWGSEYAYGGNNDTLPTGPIFEVVMAIALICNIILAFVSCMIWILSLMHSHTNPNWTYSCRFVFVYCHMLFIFMLVAVTVGLFVAILAKFKEPGLLAQTIVVFVVAMLVEAPGMMCMGILIETELPLELYHSPFWWKFWLSPFHMFTNSRRSRLKENAILRANMLKEKTTIQQQQRLDARENDKNSTLHDLLRKAAIAIGRDDIDVSIYVIRLEEQMYTEAEHLQGEDIAILERYMPRRLAKEVHKLLE